MGDEARSGPGGDRALGMPTERQWSKWDWIWLALVFAWMAAFSFPYFAHAAVDSIRQVQSYNLDSADALRAVQGGLQAPFFRLTFNDYGHFYSNLSMAVALLYSAAFELTDRALVNILRLNALVGGMATIAVTYVFAKRQLGRLYAILASGILAFSDTLLQWSLELKPDTWQLFFIMLSIHFLACAWAPDDAPGRPLAPFVPAAKFRFVVAASAAAGAAFGSKYLGMFLLPLVAWAMLGVGLEQITERHVRMFRRWLALLSPLLAIAFGAFAAFATPIRVISNFLIFPTPAMMPLFLNGLLAARAVSALIALLFLMVPLSGLLSLGRPLPERLTKVLTLVCAVAGAFWLTFFASSPWLLHRLAFVRSILARNSIVEDYPSFGLLRWLRRLFWDGTYVSEVTAVLAIGALIWLAVSAARMDWRRVNRAYIPVWGFGVIFVTLLVLKVNRATILYGMPITPLLALLAAYFLWRLVPILAARLKLDSTRLGAALSALVIVASAIETVPRVMAYPLLVTELTPDNRQLGRWLSACLPPETAIVGASYSYVPPEFQNFVGGDGMLYFDRVHPSAVVLNNRVRADVEAGPQPPTDLTSIDRMKLYRHLESWKVGPTFGELQVYLRPDARLNPSCP